MLVLKSNTNYYVSMANIVLIIAAEEYNGEGIIIMAN